MADISHYGPAAGDAASSPLYRALCVRSGNVIALGMQKSASVNCAGMALFRVFQGNVEVLGFRPPLGVYFSLHSPKWNNLLVIEGRPGNEETQAPFGPTNASLLQIMEPNLPAEAVNEDEEIAVDKLAMQLVDDFPIVLVLRAIPVTYGNVTSFYENTRPERPSAVLPGFKMIISKHNQNMLSELTAGFDYTSAAPPDADPSHHDWKSPERVLAELVVVDSVKTLNFTEPWQATVDRLEKSLVDENPQKIVVCGGKGVGKSTFCRYLVNRLLSKFGTVAFLDTDLGQSELTPSGLVALHALSTPLLGPGFAHMKHPVRSFFCGNTNPGNDPLYYMKAVKSLLRLYEVKWGRQDQDNSNSSERPRACVPLVINTDGWIKSMGHDLLCNVIQETNPDHVVQLLAATKNKQFVVPTEGRWRIHAVPPWDPVGVTQPPRSSKELRVYRFHSYFLSRARCDLPRSQLQNLQVLSEKNRVDSDIYRAYARLTPFAASFDHVDVAFAGSSVAPSQLLFSLNASVVGLCINPDYKAIESEPREGPPRIVLQPVHAPCLGVGIIRAVDAAKRQLFVVSPLPLSILKRINLLVRSSMPLDSILLSAQEPAQAPYVVTDVVASDGTGSAVMQSRNNLKRKRDGK
ncbi:Polynucleotide 5'-hydroxyl-kinase NOL9 [Phytophthora nicotianae]|uniref:Polynucleotide 5'-hydroxyl-kinase NOL9 n=1 Tax=Phytophthora nicotianae TaxID=4792 RepID=A0A0W8D146_PHYNI|nr:Polynucleotide 5'-hydroxyl-kinase NOL9 [Phytophthora nicotianae]KUF90075.1 Polynucleotide 5'-hydroxyl-kinase NOL9 [Phytophthora nicotianae]